MGADTLPCLATTLGQSWSFIIVRKVISGHGRFSLSNKDSDAKGGGVGKGWLHAAFRHSDPEGQTGA